MFSLINIKTTEDIRIIWFSESGHFNLNDNQDKIHCHSIKHVHYKSYTRKNVKPPLNKWEKSRKACLLTLCILLDVNVTLSIIWLDIGILTRQRQSFFVVSTKIGIRIIILKTCRKIMKFFFNYRAFAFSVNFNKTIKFGAYIQRKRKCMN